MNDRTSETQERSVAEIIGEIAALSAQLNSLARETVLLQGEIENIENALKDGEHPDGKVLAALYKEAGRVLPKIVEKTFEQVADFHRSITANRRVHLAAKLDGLRIRYSKRLDEVKRIEADKKRLLDTVGS